MATSTNFEDTTNSATNPLSDELMDQFLKRKRKEREEEVKRVEDVVAKDVNERKQNLETFINNATDPKESSSSRSAAASEYVLEVDYLVQARPVTSMLRSARFRRDLENVIRGSIASVSSNLSNQQSRNSGRSSPSPSLQSRTSSNSTSSSNSFQRSSNPSFHREILNAHQARSQRNINNQQGQINTLPRPSGVPNVPRSESLLPPPPPALPVQQVGEASLNAEGVRDPIPQRFERLVEPDFTFNESYQERIVQDISELLHYNLVGNTLRSDFRHILEDSMTRHLQLTNTDGQRSLAALQNLPPSGHLRNDFRHLNIIPPEEQALELEEDAVSIISATARTVPIEQSGRNMSKEMATLRKEMGEMKNIIKLLMEAQMETQRCIRQEVSAALAINSTSSTATRESLPEQRQRPMNNLDNKCLICLTNTSDTILYRCGHLCMCYSCSLELRQHQRTPTCPVCRAPVQDTLRVYIPGNSI